MDHRAYIEAEKTSLSAAIHEAANTSANEAEFRTKFANIVRDVAGTLGIELRLREEYTLATGRADAAYNRFIIEYEPPGSLRDRLDHRHTKHAVQQTMDYIEGVADEEHHALHRLAGAAIDGKYIVFVRWYDGHFHIDEPLPVNPESTEQFFKYLFSLASGAALIPDNLVMDFGAGQLLARAMCSELYSSLVGDVPDLVDKLFSQWTTLFGEVTEYSAKSEKLKAKPEFKAFVAGMGLGLSGETDLSKVFFSVHTYFAIIIKLIAWLAASRILAVRKAPPFATLSTLEDEELLARMKDMEQGGIFRAFGIRNFMEADFFGWYAQVWSSRLATGLRRILSRLNEYDPLTLEVSPEQVRDLLKKLYHFLMPKELRHDLGEYYTPDWLAEYILDEVGYDGNPSDRLIDPGCGSGTFLILALNRLKHRCLHDERMSESETLEKCLTNIVGIDLNPLAVIASRVNYLLALGNLLEYAPREIDIPVYLADSVLTPMQGKDLFTHQTYALKTAVGDFEFPSAMKEARQIEVITALLDEMVGSGASSDAFISRVSSNKDMPQPELNEEESVVVNDLLRRLFNQLKEMHDMGLNGVWARIIKNAFMPLYLGQFDFVVGNPPWVFWNYIPENHRERLREVMADTYHIIKKTASTMEQLGSVGKDLSMLFVYVGVDSYLKPRGKLGFVITQTLFQTTAGNEFRRFRLPDNEPFSVNHVDDMISLSPFKTAANKTACMFVEKSKEHEYPVPYCVWKRTQSFDRDDATIDEVYRSTVRIDRVAVPSDGQLGFWRICEQDQVEKFSSNTTSEPRYRARRGVETTLESAFRVRLISYVEKRKLFEVVNNRDRAKKPLPELHGLIEEDLLYPYITGSSVSLWRAATGGVYIVPHTADTGMKAIPEDRFATEFPNALMFFSRIRRDLESRSLHLRWGGGNSPFYSMYDIGPYTFAPFKLVWKRSTFKFEACVVTELEYSKGKKAIVVPNSELMLVPFYEITEPHYLCAIVNSSIARAYINASITTKAHRDIINVVAIPEFESADSIHQRLSELSLAAHEASDEHELDRIQQEIDLICADLWGLDAAEVNQCRSELGYEPI